MTNQSISDYSWINPIGGLGDTLMLSGVLKILNDQDGDKKFNLVRRKGYTSLLKGHPAISLIGFPTEEAKIIKTDYWSMEELGAGNQRAFQVLARSFGLKTPVMETLYYPGKINSSDLLYDLIPWKSKNVIIATSSESPRKEMHPELWHRIVESLVHKNVNVMQVGKNRELHIRNTYSLIGLTSPGELIGLVGKADLVITSDNFVMHVAYLMGVPAIVLWGPTSSDIYGYQGHTHISAPLEHCPLRNQCLGPKFPNNYTKPCPLDKEHCMNKIFPEEVLNISFKYLT